MRDAILYSLGANESHGLRRTNEDKRRAVMTMLNDAEWREWSDSKIARQCAVDRKTVTRIRESLTWEIPCERTYVTKHGTVATMDTSGIGEPGCQRDGLRLGDAEVFEFWGSIERLQSWVAIPFAAISFALARHLPQQLAGSPLGAKPDVGGDDPLAFVISLKPSVGMARRVMVFGGEG